MDSKSSFNSTIASSSNSSSNSSSIHSSNSSSIHSSLFFLFILLLRLFFQLFFQFLPSLPQIKHFLLLTLSNLFCLHSLAIWPDSLQKWHLLDPPREFSSPSELSEEEVSSWEDMEEWKKREEMEEGRRKKDEKKRVRRRRLHFSFLFFLRFRPEEHSSTFHFWISLLLQQPESQALHKLRLSRRTPTIVGEKLRVSAIEHHASPSLVDFMNQNELIPIRGKRNRDEKGHIFSFFDQGTSGMAHSDSFPKWVHALEDQMVIKLSLLHASIMWSSR